MLALALFPSAFVLVLNHAIDVSGGCVCSQGGWVVCEQDKDTLLAAYEDDIVEQRKKDAEVTTATFDSVTLTNRK